MLTSEDAEDAGIAVQEKAISEEPLETGDSNDDGQPTPSGLPTPNEPDWGTEVQAEDLSAFVTKVGRDAVGGGGFGDVYKGIWSQMDPNSNSFMKKFRVLSHLNDKEVAIKVIRPLVPDGKHRDAVKRVSEPDKPIHTYGLTPSWIVASQERNRALAATSSREHPSSRWRDLQLWRSTCTYFSLAK
jgi:hypothetical protein